MMTLTALAAVLTLTTAQPEASLTLTVEGIETQTGSLAIGVFNTQQGWDDGTAVTGRRVEVTGMTVEVDLGALPPGEYGIKLYHDVDDDGELDANLMGIPSEPFAFSNNAMGRFGPASWSDAVFAVEAAGTRHTVRLQ